MLYITRHLILLQESSSTHLGSVAIACSTEVFENADHWACLHAGRSQTSSEPSLKPYTAGTGPRRHVSKLPDLLFPTRVD